MATLENIKEIVNTGYGIARYLREHGISHVFGVPDGHTLALYDGILQTEGIDHILLNDERSAAFAADAYARVTGTLGVCDAGAAGSMNFPIALAEAKGAGSPILALVGVIKSKDILRNIPHDIKVTETLTPVSKWAGKVLDAEYLPRFLSYALKQALNGRPGPVSLIISEDVMNSNQLKLRTFIPRIKGSCSLNACRVSATSSEIDEAVMMIKKAKQPSIFSGGGTITSGAYNELKELSYSLKAPVFSTISGKGIMLPYDIDNDSYYFGTVGLFGERPNHKFIRRKSDLLIIIGNRMTEDDTANFKVPVQNQKMIQIDVDHSEIGLSYHPWAVVGDPKAVLTEMINQLKNEPIDKMIIKERLANIENLAHEHQIYRKMDKVKWIDSEPIKPQRILKSISDNFTKDDYLVTDASASSRWISAYFPVKAIGRRIITPRGVGPTGFGVGALIGTCIATESNVFKGRKPKRILFTGDGGLMNGGINEFETIKKLNLDCTIIIINNRSLGYVKFGQAMLFKKRYYHTDRPDTDFSKIGESFGFTTAGIEKLNELDSTIKKAINGDGPQLVDVIVDKMELLPPNFY